MSRIKLKMNLFDTRAIVVTFFGGESSLISRETDLFR